MFEFLFAPVSSSGRAGGRGEASVHGMRGPLGARAKGERHLALPGPVRIGFNRPARGMAGRGWVIVGGFIQALDAPSPASPRPMISDRAPSPWPAAAGAGLAPVHHARAGPP